MKDYLPYVTLLIAIYGAVLSTVTLLRGRRALKVKFEMGFLCFQNQTMTTYGTLVVTNCSSVPVYISEYGFEVGKCILHVAKIPKDIHAPLSQTTFDMLNKTTTEINKINEIFIDEIVLLQGGQSASQYFYARDIKKIFLAQPKAKVFGYCIDQTGKKYRCKISKELILSSQEPI